VFRRPAEYEHTITVGQTALALAPGESIAILVLALAHGLQNEVQLDSASYFGKNAYWQLGSSHD